MVATTSTTATAVLFRLNEEMQRTKQELRCGGEQHHTSSANKQKLRGHDDDCRISEMRSLQEGFEKDLAEKDKQREKEVKELQELLEHERTAAKQAKLDYEEQQQQHLKHLAPHAKLQEEVQEHHHTSPANKQKLRGHVDDCRLSEMRSLQEGFEKDLAEKDKQREKEVKELQDLLEHERTAAKQAKLDYEEQQQQHLKHLAPHAKLQEEVQEHHHTSPANKQKLRGHVDDCRLSEMRSLQEGFEKDLAEKDKQREKEVKELQDLLEHERTAAKQAKQVSQEKVQQLEEAQKIQQEFNKQRGEQQHEHVQQLAQQAKLQEEVQEQEKHSEFFAKELEQQRNSWKQRSDQQLEELQEVQNQMNKLKEMEAIISV